MAKPSRKLVLLPRRGKHSRRARGPAATAGLDARVAELERRFGALERATSTFALTANMRTALIASLLAHLFVIFGVGFQLAKRPPPERADHSLEVVLVNAKSPTKPVVADALAQHNLDGGGNTDEKKRAQSPLPVLPEQKADGEVKLALRRVEQLEREARQVVTQAKSSTKVESAPPAKPAPDAVAESKAEPSASDIMQRSMEIARLDAKIARDWNAYQERPRRRFIGSRTQEARFARYIEDWRQKIEKYGDVNYPQDARGVYGRLVVTVAIKSDGTVEQVDVNVPSGHKVLDQAARRIVAEAGPYARFPADMAKDVDILHITRTWTFTNRDKFVAE